MSWRGLLIRGTSLGLPPSPVDPVSIGTGFTAGLGRYGGLAAVPAEAQFLGLLPPLLLVATAIGCPVWVLASELFVPLTVLLGAFSSAWFGTVLPGEFRAAAPRRRRVFSGRPVGFFTFWPVLADFLLDLGLFRVGMMMVLSKMRSLEIPAPAG